MAVEAPVKVRCVGCGSGFELSASRVRTYRRRGSTGPLCASCRRPQPQVTEAHRRWWLARFTLDEIRELAEGIWPDG